MSRTVVPLALASLLLPVGLAYGHGSMSDPISRVYSIYQEGPKTPSSDAARWATNNCDLQAFYDWHELSRTFSNYDEPDVYVNEIEDGRIVSAGREKYACLDEPRGDWPATSVAPGPYLLEWYAHVPHDPSYFRVWVTADDYDPLSPLTWDDLEELEIGDVYRQLPYYRFQVDLPERTGRHIVYVAWQRIDPAGEVFFAACDVIFDAEPGSNPTEDDLEDPQDIVEPLAVDFRVDSAWPGTFNAEMVLTNPLANGEVDGWEVSWEGAPNVTSAWNSNLSVQGGVTTLSWADWNFLLGPGQSVTAGFAGSGDWPPEPMNVRVNGYPADVYIDGVLYHEADFPEPHMCTGDFSMDGVVDTADFSIFITSFGTDDPMTDLNEDGTTDIQDFTLFIVVFGTTCSHEH